jgi:hypothetical protein
VVSPVVVVRTVAGENGPALVPELGVGGGVGCGVGASARRARPVWTVVDGPRAGWTMETVHGAAAAGGAAGSRLALESATAAAIPASARRARRGARLCWVPCGFVGLGPLVGGVVTCRIAGPSRFRASVGWHPEDWSDKRGPPVEPVDALGAGDGDADATVWSRGPLWQGLVREVSGGLARPALPESGAGVESWSSARLSLTPKHLFLKGVRGTWGRQW